MKHELTTAQPVEVISAKESAAILKECVERIDGLEKMHQRGEALNAGIRVAIGAQLLRAKQHVPHGNSDEGKNGGFEKLIERWGYNVRTAQDWMQQANVLVAQSDKKLKSADSALFKKLLTEGVSEKEEQLVFELIPQITGGQSVSQFTEENTERKPTGGSHQIKFTCPHCGAHNRGFVGRKVKCVDATCAKQITVKPDGPSAEEKIAQIIAGEKEVGEALLVDVEQWMAREHRAEAGRDLLQRMQATQIAWGKEIKALLKKKKGKK